LSELSNEDLIDRFKNILIKYSDTPEEFAEAGGYSVISATAGRFFKSKYEFKGRPNTWIIISSIPGRMRRSTVLEAVDYVINRVNKALLSEWQSKQPKEEVKKEQERVQAQKSFFRNPDRLHRSIQM
jgi:hypothetical protein